MTNHPRPGDPVACPFCGNALREGVFHNCREMHESGGVDDQFVVLPRLANWLVIVIAFIVFVYLGAYWLVSLGVGCPTS